MGEPHTFHGGGISREHEQAQSASSPGDNSVFEVCQRRIDAPGEEGSSSEEEMTYNSQGKSIRVKRA